MSEGSLPADNPFVDPSLHETPSALQGEATLFVSEDASLTLGADAIIIFGMSHALFCARVFSLIDYRRPLRTQRGCQLLWTTADQYVRSISIYVLLA